jgi:hypothetical protein
MRIMVRVEGLLTELIFEHALRVRVKAHNPDNDVVKGAVAAENASIGEQAVASSETAHGTPSATSDDSKHPATRAVRSSIDVGKISNLVTTDLRNVTDMSDFLLLLFYLPVSLTFCGIFLYVVLGWRYVGRRFRRTMFAETITVHSSGLGRCLPCSPFLCPPRGTFRSSRRRASRRPMRALGRSARVRLNRVSFLDCSLTPFPAMNVLRMVKMFGWEDKMLARVNEKREVELTWIWKREIFEWVANTIK